MDLKVWSLKILFLLLRLSKPYSILVTEQQHLQL